MDTPYDWITVLFFIGLVALFFKQGNQDTPTIIKYAGVGLALAVANQLGNRGNALGAWMIIAASAIYSYVFLLRKA
jgi:hypothetical protein